MPGSPANWRGPTEAELGQDMTVPGGIVTWWLGGRGERERVRGADENWCMCYWYH